MNAPKPDPQRRQFLQYSAALGGGLPLVGCGGGSGGAAAEAGAADATTAHAAIVPVPNSRTPVPPPPPPPPPPAPAPAPVAAVTTLGLFTGAMQFSLVSPKTQTKAPFSLGFAFRRGDVPAGSTVTSNLSGLQVTPRTTWPDGSLKFAQLAGFADLTANVMTTVRLRAAAADGRVVVPLALADLKKTGLTAEVGAGSFGTASFAGADWDAPHTSWVGGAQMSSWIFRKPVGTDPHLVAWLEVRLYAGGAVEVLPWVENGYLMVAAPKSKAAVFTFALGGSQRFSASIDLPHHCRTPLISGTALSYWLGTDPDVTPKHDLAYLQSTEQVPTYSARVAPTAPVAQALASTWTPLGKANLVYDSDSMRSPGYQSSIGLLPEHDVLYLTCESPATYGAVVRNGFAAGRYGMHYRDEKTQRPIRFSQYPNLALAQSFSGFYDQGGSTRGQYTPTATGTAPVSWDCAHSPAVGYLAYLVTGRFFFMEAVQFAATFNYLGKGDADPLRKGALGLVQSCVGAWQVRAAAWQWRTLAMALNVTPDSDATLKDEFLASAQANIDHYHSTYVAQPNNPFGWVQGESYNSTGAYFDASWMQDFVTAAWGFSLSMGLPLPAAASTKMEAFFQWKARTAVMRLGPAGGFWYVNGAPYTMSVSPVTVPDFATGKGPWHANEAQAYAATYASAPTWLSKVEGQLAAEAMPGERSMWGNLMPAISYAVRHNVPGATAAWQRLTRASNFSALRDAFHTAPVWSVAPARITPAWLAGKPIGQWIEIPNTAGAGGSAVDAFSGMAVNDLTSEIIIAAAGGHGDSSDNRVVSISLAADAPAWVQRSAPSTTVAANVAYYADGLPTSRHTYQSIHFVPQINRLMLFGTYGAYGSAWAFPTVDGFNLDTNKWDKSGTYGDMPGGFYGAGMIRATGEVVSTQLKKKWSPVTRAWTDFVTNANDQAPVRWPVAYDSRRNQLFSLQWGDGQGVGSGVVANRVPLDGSLVVPVSFNASAALSQFQADQPAYAGMDYDPDGDRFLFYAGAGAAAGRVYVVKPGDGNVWDISVLNTGTTKVPASPASGSGINSRLRYVPALRGFVLLAQASANLYFLRTA
ncbi:MAG: hypothetical protein EKK53_07460 [Burkholderiales bacterium]|nr:MAG: hypothetical protein EKK53_07460 [Burkholderiales bacterium]